MTAPDGYSPAATLASTLRDAAIVVDAEDRVLAWNDAAGMLLVMAPDSAGRTLAELGLWDLAGAARLPVAVSGSDGDAPVALLVWHPGAPPPDVDIELQKIRALSRLAPGVNHQGLNHLAGFSAFFGMLRGDDTFVDAYGETLIRDLEDNAKRAPQLLRAFAELARDRSPAPAPQPLRTRVEPALMLIEYAMDVRRTVSIPEGLPDVIADASRLHQAIVALLINTLDALGGRSARGSLAVTATPSPDGQPFLELVIEDDAATVEPRDRAHLFDRVPPPGTTPRAGLDLAVARRLIEADGGSLRYEPGVLGGNRLVVRLPSEAPALDDRASAPAGAASAPAQLTVLVCDDDDAIRALMTRLLQRNRHRVLLAGSASEALSTLDRVPVDVVMSDHRMAEMSGVELYAAVCERHPSLRTRFVLMSGDPGAQELVAFTSTTGLPVLGKPFSSVELDQIIRDIART